MQKSFEQQGPPRRAASGVWDVDLSEEFSGFPSLTAATVPAKTAVRPRDQDRSEPKRRRAEGEPSSAVGRGTAAQPPASALGSFEQRDQLDKRALPVQAIRKGTDEVSCSTPSVAIEVSFSTPSVPASGSSEWLSGAALEDILINQMPEQMQKIDRMQFVLTDVFQEPLIDGIAYDCDIGDSDDDREFGHLLDDAEMGEGPAGNLNA